MQGGFQHFHYIIGSDLTLFASNHTGTRLIHHRKPSVHQLPAALSLFARCWLNLAILLSVLKAFTAILYCTEIQYLLKCGRRSILFATATASMRAQSGPYLGVLDLTRTERHSSVLCVVWIQQVERTDTDTDRVPSHGCGCKHPPVLDTEINSEMIQQ